MTTVTSSRKTHQHHISPLKNKETKPSTSPPPMPLHCYTLTSRQLLHVNNMLQQLANHEIEDSTIFVVCQLNICIKANFHFELLSIAHVNINILSNG